MASEITGNRTPSRRKLARTNLQGDSMPNFRNSARFGFVFRKKPIAAARVRNSSLGRVADEVSIGCGDLARSQVAEDRHLSMITRPHRRWPGNSFPHLSNHLVRKSFDRETCQRWNRFRQLQTNAQAGSARFVADVTG